MKKSYLILAISLTVTAVAIIVNRGVFAAKDAFPTAAVSSTTHPTSTTHGKAHSISSEQHLQRTGRVPTTSWKVAATDPSQATEVENLYSFAKERLEVLDKELSLNAKQQQRILELLMAYAAPSDLSFQIGGRTIKAPDSSMEDAILQELDAERAGIYQQALMDHASWWDHAIEEMERTLAEEEQAQSNDPIVID